MKKDWNFERYRTRDRLLDYAFDPIFSLPSNKKIPIIYPWENINSSILSEQIYKIAQAHGFDGDFDEFWERFNTGGIVTGTIATFPIPGKENTLYLDLTTNILYYFKSTNEIINTEAAEELHIEIVGTSSDNIFTYLYIPVRAMPIENLIFDSGTAQEYID